MKSALLSINPYALNFCLILLVLPCSLRSQHYTFDSYGPAEGLTDGQVQEMVFDQKGFLWVAAPTGLFRFLGSRFEYYGREQGLTDHNVLEVYVDVQDRIWAATQFQLFLLRGNGFSCIGPRIRLRSTGHHMLALAPDLLLVIDDGKLKTLDLDESNGSGSLVPVFSSEQRNARPELNDIHTLATAKDGTVWLACGNRICSLEKGTLQTWGSDQGVKANQWVTLYIDSRGSLWVASRNRILEHPAGSKLFEDRSPLNVPTGFLFWWAPIAEDRLVAYWSTR